MWELPDKPIKALALKVGVRTPLAATQSHWSDAKDSREPLYSEITSNLRAHWGLAEGTSRLER